MKILFSTLIVLSSLVFTFAQEKSIEKVDFEQIRKTSVEILQAKPHRITTVSETKVNGKTQQEKRSSKMIIEVNGDKKRYVNEQTSNQSNTKNEYIQVGGKAFQRANNGDWKETAVYQSNQSNEIKTIEEESAYKSIGTENFNGKTAKVYLKTSKSKRLDAGNNNQEIISQESVKYWIDPNGTLLKREVNRENQVGKITFNFNIVSVFEYDPTIEINAPGSN